MSNKRNTFWLAVQYIITLAVSFVTLKLNLINFGEELFGIWIMFASVWGIGSVLDFGFGLAIIKYVAQAYESGDSTKINKIFSTGLLLFLGVGAIIVAGGNILAELIFYSNVKIVPVHLLSEMRPVFIILGLSFYFQYLSILFRSVFEGHSDFVVTSRLQIINNLVLLFFVGAITAFRFSIIWLSTAYMAISLLFVLFYIAALRRRHSSIRFGFAYIDFKEIRKIFGFSLNVQLISILGAAIDPAIKYVLSSNSSVSIVPLYEVARRLSLAVSGLFANSFRTVLPKTSILKTPEDYQNFMLREGAGLFRFGIVYSGTIFGAGALAFALVIKLWFGFNESIIIFFILSLAESVNNTGYPIYLFLLGIGKAFYLIYIQLFNLIVISLSIILGFLIFGNYLGLFGYFAAVFMANILMLYFLKKEVSFSLIPFLRQTRIHKLLIFNLLVLAAIILLAVTQSVYLVSAGLSLVSFLLFYKEIIHYSMLVLKILKTGELAVK